MPPLISAAELQAALGRVVIFDATYYLPNENKSGVEEFARAHIPGARYFNINEVADQDTDLPHMVPTAFRFAKLVGAMGVGNDSHVVFYDQTGTTRAPRGWWLFRLFGHEKVQVLDGGLPAWRAAGLATEAGTPAAATPVAFTPDFRAERLKGIGDMKRIVAEGSAQVIDARARGRFEGTAPEPRAGLPNGHMPGAGNLPVTEIMGADGRLLPPETLRGLYRDAGADGARPLVMSCGSGVTASALALGAVVAGLPEPAVYDGSWTEWALRPETPKVTGR
ncbi:MAG TPA: sulfurtransferase [Roseomonas sp.]|jgi:thiosulfate/3-mercaptopyruvate sulfurtransferase